MRCGDYVGVKDSTLSILDQWARITSLRLNRISGGHVLTRHHAPTSSSGVAWMALRAVRTGFALFATVWLASGCGTLYSETRDKQGQAAKEAWGKVDLPAQLSVPRKNQQALLDERLKLEDELWAQRKVRLAQLVAGLKVSEFRARVENDAKRVLGDGHTLDELNKSRLALQTAKETYRVDTAGVLSAGLSLPSCDLVLTAKDNSAPGHDQAKTALAALVAAAPASAAGYLDKVIKDANNNCRQLATGLGDFGGELGAAQKALKDDQEALRTSRIKAEAAHANYKKATAEYETALRQFTDDVKDGKDTDASREKLDDVLTKAADAFAGLKDAQDSFSIKLVSEARLDSIDRFLSTYTDVRDGKGSPENASKVAIALAVFPDLRAKAEVVLKDLQKPNLVPLTLQKDIEKAKLDGAQRDIDIISTRLALRQAHVDALAAQGHAYWQAYRALGAEGVKKLYDDKLMFDALQPLAPTDFGDRSNDGPVQNKKRLWMASALYLDAEGKLRAEGVKAEHRIVALSYEQASSLAESNIAQWKALIDPSVDLMASYGASGLKSSDIAAFLNTLTLLWIGVGVN